MTIEEAELLVQRTWPDAHPIIDRYGAWSICNGTRTKNGPVRITGVGWHESAEAAWIKAAEIVQSPEPRG